MISYCEWRCSAVYAAFASQLYLDDTVRGRNFLLCSRYERAKQLLVLRTRRCGIVADDASKMLQDAKAAAAVESANATKA